MQTHASGTSESDVSIFFPPVDTLLYITWFCLPSLPWTGHPSRTLAALLWFRNHTQITCVVRGVAGNLSVQAPTVSIFCDTYTAGKWKTLCKGIFLSGWMQMVVGGFTPLRAKKIHSFIGPGTNLRLQKRKTGTKQCICLLLLTCSSSHKNVEC